MTKMADIYCTLAVVKYDIGLTQSTCTCTAIEIRTNLVRIIVKVMLKQ